MSQGPVAQWESTRFTREGSLVRNQPGPPARAGIPEPAGRGAGRAGRSRCTGPLDRARRRASRCRRRLGDNLFEAATNRGHRSLSLQAGLGRVPCSCRSGGSVNAERALGSFRSPTVRTTRRASSVRRDRVGPRRPPCRTGAREFRRAVRRWRGRGGRDQRGRGDLRDRARGARLGVGTYALRLVSADRAVESDVVVRVPRRTRRPVTLRRKRRGRRTPGPLSRCRRRCARRRRRGSR